jgi:predicted N-acetyltransferase YhbS
MTTADESASAAAALTVTTHPITAADAVAIGRLHAAVFGPGRFARTAYRIREGTPFASPFCRKAVQGDDLLATIRFTEIAIGGSAGALLLGPLAVAPAVTGQGHGKRLVAEGLETARHAGVSLVLLVGNEPYYGRFGFKPVPRGQILFPGPVDPARLLVVELTPNALAGMRGLVTASQPPCARPSSA